MPIMPTSGVSKKTMENQHQACILEAKYYLNVRRVYFKLALCTDQKKILIDPVLWLYTKV